MHCSRVILRRCSARRSSRIAVSAIAAVIPSTGAAMRAAGDVALDGTTHVETGTANTGGLRGQYHTFAQRSDTPAAVDGQDGSRMFLPTLFPQYQQFLNDTTPATLTTSTTPFSYSNVDYGNNTSSAPFSTVGVTATDNLTARWVGYINILTSGNTQFFTSSDDGSMLYIDGQVVVNNDAFQGNTERSGTINLSSGLHEIVVSYFEGTGNARMLASYTPNGGTKQVIPVTDAGSNQILTGHETAPLDRTADNFILTANTSLQTQYYTRVNAGQLQVQFPGPSSTLTLTNQGAEYAFTGTTFSSAGTLALSAQNSLLADYRLGQLDDGGNAVLIQKQGTNNLILDRTDVASTTANTTIDVQAGALIAIGASGANNPLGAATIQLSTADSQVIFGKKATGTVSFDNAINVTGNGSIFTRRVNANSGGSPDDDTITLSGPITLTGTPALTLGTESSLNGSDYTLAVSGNISGGGDVHVSTSNVVLFNTSGKTYTGATAVDRGTLRIGVAGAVPSSSGIAINDRGTLDLNVANSLVQAVPISIHGTSNSVQGTLQFSAANAWSGTVPTITDANFARYLVTNATAIGAPLTVAAGRILDINVGGLTGSGVITHGAGTKVRVTNSSGLNGAQFPASGIAAGEILQLNASNIANLNSVPGSAIFQVYGGDRTSTAAINLDRDTSMNIQDSGVLTQEGTNNRKFTGSGGINIGSNGGTIASTSGATLTINDTSVVGGSNTVTIGATSSIDGSAKAGTVTYIGTSGTPSFQAGAVNLVAGTFTHGGGGPTFQLGGSGTPGDGTGIGPFNVASGTTVAWQTGIMADARIINAGTVRFRGPGAFTNGVSQEAVSSIEGSGSLIIGHNATAGTVVLSTGANGLSTMYSGQISDDNTGSGRTGAIDKVGTGTMQLTRAAGNSYSGGTTVDGGTLLVSNTSGSATGTGAVIVNDGGTIGGGGSIAGPLTINTGGTLAPGNLSLFTSAGPVTFGTDGAGAAPVYVAQLGPANTSDRLVLSGTGAQGVLDLSNNDVLDLVTTNTGSFSIATFDSSNGTFDTVLMNNGPAQAGTDYTIAYNATSIQVDVLRVVPEPGAALLFGIAAAGAGLLRRRRIARLV